MPRLIATLALLLALAACESTAANTPAPTVAVPTTAAPVIVPTVTPLPTLGATSTPAPTIAPTAAPVPAPAARLRQLTSGTCCTQPTWSPDSRQVRFIDKPAENAPAGIYGVDVASPGAPKLVTERVAFYSADWQYVTTLDANFVTIERLSDGQKFRIRTGGRNVLVSPDRTRVVWSETPQNGPLETRTTTVMGANIDGSDARPVTTLLRGGVSAWLGNDRLLMTSRLSRDSQDVVLSAYSLATGARTELARSERLRSTLVSPGGDWIVYTINFDRDTARNGTWLVRTDGSARRRLNFFGAFQWRDSNRLFYLPLDLDKPSHAIHEYDTLKDSYRRLTDPATQPFKIANGDWVAAPDGKQIVFLNAKDLNLWLWEFEN